MKCLLLGALLIGAIVCGPKIPDSSHYKELIAKLNYERREYAKATGITNMHKLFWNDALAQESVLKPNNQTRNFRHFLTMRNAEAISFEARLADTLLVWRSQKDPAYQRFLDRGEENQSVMTLEHLVPLQRGIACFPDNVQLEVSLGIRENISYSTICLIGPERSFKNSFTDRKVGCGASREPNRGLCISPAKGDFEPFGPLAPINNTKKSRRVSRKKFSKDMDIVDKMNYERREFAKAMNISNMHKLHWSSKLETRHFEATKANNYIPNYRMFGVQRNYPAILYERHMLGLIESFKWNNTEEVDKIIKENKEILSFFHHLIPTQKGIGCTDWRHDLKRNSTVYGAVLYRVYKGVCAIGPEAGDFKYADWKFGPAGTGCGNDTVEDGLCVSFLPKNFTHYKWLQTKEIAASVAAEEERTKQMGNTTAIVTWLRSLASRNVPPLQRIPTNVNSSIVPPSENATLPEDSLPEVTPTNGTTLKESVPTVFPQNVTNSNETLSNPPSSNSTSTNEAPSFDNSTIGTQQNVSHSNVTSSIVPPSANLTIPEDRTATQPEVTSPEVTSPNITNSNDTLSKPTPPKETSLNENSTVGTQQNVTDSNGTSPVASPSVNLTSPEHIPANETKPEDNLPEGTATNGTTLRESVPIVFPPNITDSNETLSNSTSPNEAPSIDNSTIGTQQNVTDSNETSPIHSSNVTSPIATPQDQQETHGFEDLVVKVNYERREYAKAMSVSNMYKLEWSDFLEKRAQTLFTTWFPPNETKYRHFFAGRNKDGIIFENKVNDWIYTVYEKNKTSLEEWSESNDKKTVITLEQFLPLQREIGCAEWNTTFYYKSFDKEFNVEYSTICLLGPEISYVNSVRKTGQPGSDCGIDVVEDGLCVHKNAAKELGDLISTVLSNPNNTRIS